MQINNYQQSLFQKNQRSQIQKLKSATKQTPLNLRKHMNIIHDKLARINTKELSLQSSDLGLKMADTETAQRYIIM